MTSARSPYDDSGDRVVTKWLQIGYLVQRAGLGERRRDGLDHVGGDAIVRRTCSRRGRFAGGRRRVASPLRDKDCASAGALYSHP